MKKFLFLQIFCVALLAIALVADAAQIAVPTPIPFSEKLPPAVVVQCRNAVVEGVRQAHFDVLAEDASNRLLAMMTGLDEDGQAEVLRNKRIDGMLLVRVERNIGGFVLQIEPRGCASGLGIAQNSFSVQIGSLQNLPQCIPDIASRLLRSETGEADSPMMVLLMPRIKDPRTPLALKNSLGSFLENALLAKGYRVCSGRKVEEALRVNRLGGFFEVTPERCQKLGNTLLVKTGSVIEVTVDAYELQTVSDGRNGKVFQISLNGRIREFSTSSGKITFEKVFQLNQFKSSDPRTADLSPTIRNNASAFSQFALELALREQVLSAWPPTRK